ncbi:hypothetical protein [Mesorhizobium sp. CA16]|uniref:hypothetical protein n=1 Tax=Mesorhizobium sp. CA16 TaxID=588496 RepID=UPI001CCF280E|nr:hypothetical protein [Mesorhizobium sp. CA16]MBZ9913523.1 hypothetical protein [Mesorhizobium sp. CA16]
MVAGQKPERVSISAAGENRPGVLDARLFRPQGCSGLWNSRTIRLSPCHADWGRRLAALGYVVLSPDSYGSREISL